MSVKKISAFYKEYKIQLLYKAGKRHEPHRKGKTQPKG
jgi:hypothetical protein